MTTLSNPVSEARSNDTARPGTPAAKSSTVRRRVFGNQALLRMILSSPIAIQRMSDPSPVTVDGEKVQLPQAPPNEGTEENIENPEIALAEIDQGAPFGGAAKPEDEGKAVQNAAHGSPAAASPISPRSVLSRLGGGQPLAAGLRTRMERALGADFRGVRIHTGDGDGVLANALGAHAFTLGEHVAFASGRYAPDTGATERLVAHELTHVIQQRRGLSGSILAAGIGHPGDVYEREADQAAERVGAGLSLAAHKNDSTPAAGEGGEGALQLFSGSNAAAYAKKWALGTNPTYLRFSDDCTNFVSQAMHEGGWADLWGADACDDRKNDSVWWFKKDQCWRPPPFDNIHASHTWGGAHNFFRFISASGRATSASAISDLQVGDVLQRDHGDGTMHHSMVVTERGTENVGGADIVQLKLSYHTNDTLDKKFWGPGGILEGTPAGWKYFAWRIK